MALSDSTQYAKLINSPETLKNIIHNSTLSYKPEQCKHGTQPQLSPTNIKGCWVTKDDLPHKLEAVKCPQALMAMAVELLVANPCLMDAQIRQEITNYYKHIKINACGLASQHVLERLKHSTSSTPMWIAYEMLLRELIKQRVYQPMGLANELIKLSKCEGLDPKTGRDFASVIRSCVDSCRVVSDQDEEEKEKWCEIIDWMSWLLGCDDADFDC